MSSKNQENLEVIEEKEPIQSQEEKPAEVPKKKAMNLSEEERQRRSERMKKLREKLDNIGSVPKVKPPEPSKKKTIPKKEVEPVNNDVESDESESEEEEPVKPVKKLQKNKVKETPKKTMPRKVLKIKYYHEPTQAEMLQDRLFLENQHRQDNEFTLSKNKQDDNKKSNDNISDKLFNY